MRLNLNAAIIGGEKAGRATGHPQVKHRMI